jgi:hypothetical protein
MKKRNIAIFCVYLITVVGSFVGALEFEKGWTHDSLFLFCLNLGFGVPFVTGVLSLLDFGASFLPSMRYGTVWRCLFGSLGILMLLLYADAFWWHPLTEFHTHGGVSLTLAIWVCWIIRFVIERRKKRALTVGAS